MADFLASQRVRLFDGTNDKGFATGQPLIVRLSDGTDLSLIDGSGNLQVVVGAALPAGTNNIGDVDVLSVVPGVAATNLGKAVDDAAGATDTGVAALAVRDDALSTLTPADGDYTPLRVTSTGALWVTLTAAGNTDVIQDDSAFTPATSYVGAAGFFADETAPDSVDEGDIGAARMTLDRKQLMVLVDKTTDANRLAIDASGYITVNQSGTVNVDIQDSWAGLTGGGTEAGVLRVTIANDSTGVITVDASDLDIRNLNLTDDAVKVSANTTANSQTNPIFVQVVSGVVSGNEVVFYGTSAAVAANGTANIDYTVTGSTTAKVLYIRASASGAFKVTVSSGPLATLVTKEVGFAGAAMPQVYLEYNGLLEVPSTSTGTIRVAIRNDDNQAMDVYATIVMTEV